jgi:hypothetical protein
MLLNMPRIIVAHLQFFNNEGIAIACRSDQELCDFGFDPQS